MRKRCPAVKPIIHAQRFVPCQVQPTDEVLIEETDEIVKVSNESAGNDS